MPLVAGITGAGLLVAAVGCPRRPSPRWPPASPVPAWRSPPRRSRRLPALGPNGPGRLRCRPRRRRSWATTRAWLRPPALRSPCSSAPCRWPPLLVRGLGPRLAERRIPPAAALGASAALAALGAVLVDGGDVSLVVGTAVALAAHRRAVGGRPHQRAARWAAAPAPLGRCPRSPASPPRRWWWPAQPASPPSTPGPTCWRAASTPRPACRRLATGSWKPPRPRSPKPRPASPSPTTGSRLRSSPSPSGPSRASPRTSARPAPSSIRAATWPSPPSPSPTGPAPRTSRSSTAGCPSRRQPRSAPSWPRPAPCWRHPGPPRRHRFAVAGRRGPCGLGRPSPPRSPTPTPSIEVAAETTRLLPGLLGGDGSRRWFVAVLSTSELRGAGGLLGNYAVLTADDGEVALERSGAIAELNASTDRTASRTPSRPSTASCTRPGPRNGSGRTSP